VALIDWGSLIEIYNDPQTLTSQTKDDKNNTFNLCSTASLSVAILTSSKVIDYLVCFLMTNLLSYS
jgi:hypothetical protein